MRTPQQPPGNTRRRRRPAAAATAGDNWLWGRHAVAAALANPARRWRRLVVPAVERDAAAALAAAAHAEHLGGGAAVDIVERATINRLLPQGAVHQGWALAVEPLPEPDFDEILRGIAALPDRAIIVVLDRVSDPHNVGAVLRTAAAFGAAAVVVAEHGAPPVTGVVAKAASGALELVPLVRAVNIARTLARLKAAGFWCCGLDAAAPKPLAALDPGSRVALVLGAEGSGLRRLVREECDFLARLPTRPAQPSLNVSNAAAIALYELARRDGDG